MLLESGVTDAELQVEANRVADKVESVFSSYLAGSGDGQQRTDAAFGRRATRRGPDPHRLPDREAVGIRSDGAYLHPYP